VIPPVGVVVVVLVVVVVVVVVDVTAEPTMSCLRIFMIMPTTTTEIFIRNKLDHAKLLKFGIKAHSENVPSMSVTVRHRQIQCTESN
jgi:hypothetical protein